MLAFLSPYADGDVTVSVVASPLFVYLNSFLVFLFLGIVSLRLIVSWEKHKRLSIVFNIMLAVLFFGFLAALSVGIAVAFFLIFLLLRFFFRKEKHRNIARPLNVLLLIISLVTGGMFVYGHNRFAQSVTPTHDNMKWKIETMDIAEIEGYIDSTGEVEDRYKLVEYFFNLRDCQAEKSTYKRSRTKPNSQIVWKNTNGQSHTLNVTAEKTERHGMRVRGGTFYECTIHWEDVNEVKKQ